MPSQASSCVSNSSLGFYYRVVLPTVAIFLGLTQEFRKRWRVFSRLAVLVCVFSIILVSTVKTPRVLIFILPKRVGRNSVLLYLVHRLGPIPVGGNLLTNGAKSVTFLIQSRSLLRTRVVLNREKDLTYKVDFCAQSGGQLLKLSKIYLWIDVKVPRISKERLWDLTFLLLQC